MRPGLKVLWLFLTAALYPSVPGWAQAPGEVFQDCSGCPQMVVIPGGSFLMGSPEDEAGRFQDEGPSRRVTISPFAAGRLEITQDQYSACVAAGPCSPAPNSGFGGGDHPATYVSWTDAKAYIKWLSAQTGRTYRLLSEAEWEYAARAGTDTAYWWGEAADRAFANYGSDQCCLGSASGEDRWERTAPVGSFPANAFGLHDMHGNVWELVEDCYAQYYASGRSDDGSPFVRGECAFRIYRGGSWSYDPRYLRSAYRSWSSVTNRSAHLGFRVARDL